MIQWAIVDAGPLVALLDEKEHYHPWSMEAFHTLRGPLITCELVICEAFFLLKHLPAAQEKLLEWIKLGSLSVPFILATEAEPIRILLNKYRDRPMSLADACLVRMAELYERYYIFTLDSDFTVYRKHGREPLKLICPKEIESHGFEGK